jgi:hypothetical protein
MRLKVAALLFAAGIQGAAAQPVFVSEFNYNPYDSTKSPLNTWDGTAFSKANVMVGESMQTGRAVQAFRGANGKTYVVTIQPFYSNNFFTFEYDNGLYIPLGAVRVGGSVYAAQSFVLSPDRTRAYVLMSAGGLYPVDIGNPSNPVVGTPYATFPGSVRIDIRPQGDRVIGVGYGAVVYDLNLVTGALSSLNLSLNYFQPQLRISPDGSFAYFGLEDTNHSFAVIDTSTFPATFIKVEPGLGGNFGMADVAFHPTLKRAYFMSWPAGSTASPYLFVVDTNTHTGIGAVNVLGSNYAHYTVEIEPDGSAIWMALASNAVYLMRIPVDASGVPQPANVGVTIPAITTAISAVAVVRTPVGATPLFLPTLGTKSGTQASRVWPLRIRNTGQQAVFNVQVSQVILTQVAGPACSPVIQTATPISYGNIAPGATTSNNVTINFTGCAFTARFKLEAVIGAGPTSQSYIVANNQTM